MQPGGRPAGRSAVVVAYRGPLLLADSLAPLVVETPGLGAGSGPGGHPYGLHPEGVVDAGSQALKGLVAVSQLGPLIARGGSDGGTEPLAKSLALVWSERGRPLDVEPHLGAGARSVGVLATGSAARCEPPLQLVEPDAQVPVDPQPARLRARSAGFAHKWLGPKTPMPCRRRLDREIWRRPMIG